MSENAKNHRMEDILLYEQDLLEADERRELEEHLRGCAECQATVVTVKKYLPMLHEALKPDAIAPEERLKRVKAQLRAEELAEEQAPASFFMRARLALAGFAAAATAAVFIAMQMLSTGPELVAKAAPDAGAEPGYVAKTAQDAGRVPGVVAAPHRPQPGYVAAPHRPQSKAPDEEMDAGMDAGVVDAGTVEAVPASAPPEKGGENQ